VHLSLSGLWSYTTRWDTISFTTSQPETTAPEQAR
jgi:hypothetical protein